MDVLQVLQAINQNLERIAVSLETMAQSVKKSKTEKKTAEGDQA